MEEVLRGFNEHGVRYLVIGGQAVRLFGVPRFSMDWDIFIPPRDIANIETINGLLRDALDLPLEPLGPHGEGFIQTYQTRWGILQFHLGGPGLPVFDEAWRRLTKRATESGLMVPCLNVRDLITAKKAAARLQDLEDVEYLEALPDDLA